MKLQAVSLALRRLEKSDESEDKSSYILQDNGSMTMQEKKSALLDIKKGIFAEIDRGNQTV